MGGGGRNTERSKPAWATEPVCKGRELIREKPRGREIGMKEGGRQYGSWGGRPWGPEFPPPSLMGCRVWTETRMKLSSLPGDVNIEALWDHED